MPFRLRSDLLSRFPKRPDSEGRPNRRILLALLLVFGNLGAFCSAHLVVALPFQVLEGADGGPLTWKGGAILVGVAAGFLFLLLRAARGLRAGLLHADTGAFALGVLDSGVVCLLLKTHAAWTLWAIAFLTGLALLLSLASAGAFMRGTLELGGS